MTISIQPSALVDLKRGYRFYESQSEGLSAYFLDTLYSDIDSLQLYAGIHSVHFGKFRLLSSRFPFAVHYEIEGSAVLIRAFLDLRRDPSWIAHELGRQGQ